MTGTFLNQVNAIAYFWGEGELDKEQSAVYDLHEGYLKGVIDFIPDPPTGEWTQNGWQQQIGPYTVGEGCTYLRVNHGPFEPAWMFTPQADASSNPLEVTLTDGTNSVTVTVLGTRINTPDQQAHLELVVQGTSLPAWVDTGVWYHIHGDRYKANVAQSGTWTTPASGSTFTVYGKAGLTSEMQGWILQPDINQQVYLTVETVSPGSGALTVAGDYSSLGQVGKHWRLYAPPGIITGRTVSGVHTDGNDAGTLSWWVSACSSRCLFAGYRYEAPLAGIWDRSGITPVLTHRQAGRNFAGQHYTLFRHYDPVLMRFTGPDPIAAEFWNLNSYSGNSPGRFYDPDGLNPMTDTYLSDGNNGFESKGNYLMPYPEGGAPMLLPRGDGGTFRDFVFGASYESREVLTGKYSLWGMVTGKGLYGLFVSEEEFGAEYAVNTDTIGLVP